jgi:hypothetical protein
MILASLLLLTVLTVIVAVALDELKLGIHRPDLYNPEREALIEAEWQLSQSAPHGSTSVDVTQATHRHIRSVLDWLEKAEDVQPQHRQRIVAVRERVAELEAADREAAANARHRVQLYQEIMKELEHLMAPYRPSPRPGRLDYGSEGG